MRETRTTVDDDAAAAPGLIPALRLSGVSKAFGPVQALSDVTFDCHAGEIHALVGENGAGKSTLMAVASGVVEADAGEIFIAGSRVEHPTPQLMRDLGVAVAYQDGSLVPDLSIAENLLFGLPRAQQNLAGRQLHAWAAEQLGGFSLGLDTRLTPTDITASERQVLEICKAVVSEPTILVLDEPTAALGPAEVDVLFDVLRTLSDRHVGIAYISHRLPEVLLLADRVTVLRDGSVQSTWPRAEIVDEDQLVTMMIGRPVEAAFPGKADGSGKDVVLEVDALSAGIVDRAAMQVRRGEIVGLGGMEGNGQREFIRALAGLTPSTGEVRCAGKRVRRASPVHACAAGLAFISSDRRGEAVAPTLTMRENLVASVLSRVASLGFVRRQREVSVADAELKKLDIRPPELESTVDQLSGGNQQKVALGRALLSDPEVLLIDEPTQGVDAGARVDFYRRLRDTVAPGAAVVINSSDAVELAGLCDRVLVFSRGHIAAELHGDGVTEASLVGAAARAGRRERSEADGNAFTYVRLRKHWAVPVGVLSLAVALLAVYTGGQAPRFFSDSAMTDTLLLAVPIAIAAYAQVAVLLGGGIDLSVGPVMGLMTVLLSYLVAEPASGGDIVLAIIVCLLVGALVGAINAFLVEWLSINPVAATLATFTAVLGVGQIIRATPGGSIGTDFADMLTFSIGFVPVAFIVVVAVAVAGDALLRRRRIGRSMRAVGSRPVAANRLGISARTVRAGSYIVCSMTAALAGCFLATSTGVGDALVGTEYTLQGITAVVLGGAAITGGRGSYVGALLGALLLGTLVVAGGFLEWQSATTRIFTGGLMIAAIGLYARIRGEGIAFGSSALGRLLARARPTTDQTADGPPSVSGPSTPTKGDR